MKKRKPRIPKKMIEKLMEYFVAGATARTAAELANVNRNTATKYFRLFREVIASNIQEEYQFAGEVELDESYFGGQ